MIKHILATSFGTLISRIFGLARDFTIASLLGAGSLSDSFLVAFRFPNLFRAFFAEGINCVTIPMYTRAKLRGNGEAISFTNRLFSMMCFTLTTICILTHIFMPEVISLFTPGFKEQQLNTTVELARIMNPFILLVSLFTICSNVMQANGKFFISSALPSLINIFIIVSQINPFNTPEYNMSYAVLFAGISQLGIALYVLYKSNHSIIFSFDFRKEEAREFFMNVLPVIFGNCVMQLNIFINTIFASSLDGAVSYIYYADRISQLPQSLIGTAIGTVLLPSITKNIQSSNISQARLNQKKAMEFGMFFCIPATVALISIPELIIFGLFGHGTFDNNAAFNTASVLRIFGYSLPAFVISRISLAVLYANENRKIPIIGASLSLITNLILNFALTDYKYLGVAIAVTSAGWVNALFLGIASHFKIRLGIDTQNPDIAFGKSITHIFIASSIMLIVISTLDMFAIQFMIRYSGFMGRLTMLAIVSVIGAIVYLYSMKKLTKKSLAQMLGIEDN